MIRFPRLAAFRHALLYTWRGRACAGTLFLIAFVAVAAPWIAPHDPYDQGNPILAGPSGAHWLGTDDIGRDALSRLIYSTRVSVPASLWCVFVATVIGFPIGLVAGYLGGAVDAIVMRVIDTILAFPAIILAIGLTAMMGPGIRNAMVAVGIVLSPSIARLMRAQTMAVRNEQFIEVSRSLGVRSFRMAYRHIVPNAIQPVLVQMTSLLGYALLAEAGLSFLGLGVQPPEPSWGGMLARSYAFIAISPLQIIIPGVVIVMTVLAFTTLGDLVQQALDPKRWTHRGRSDAADDDIEATDTSPPWRGELGETA